MRPTLSMYREALKLLAKDRMGIALDITCSHCGYPEMSGIIDMNNAGPIGVRLCRRCGHTEVFK